MAIYSVMARFYDDFTTDVPYRAWAEYIIALFAKYQVRPKLVLDLACGTGNLTKLLAEAGYEMIGVDMSEDMLAAAAAKTAALSPQPLFLRQRMEALDLYGTVDAAVCALDSINYLTTYAALEAAFGRIGLFLNAGGLFIFDVNTEAKFRSIDMQVFARETEACFCVWQADYEARRRIMNYYLDFFVRRTKNCYERCTERHAERAHSLPELRAALEKAGLRIEAVLGELKTEEPRPDEGRVFIVARKV